jgi:predicted HicB family RNase H-like nuclease
MGVRLLPEEHDRIREAAEMQGVSMSELVISLVRSSAPGLIGADGSRAAS